MRNILIESLEVARVPHHKEAKTVTIEGPRFSTFAESELYRDVFKAQIVNMTTVPEGRAYNLHTEAKIKPRRRKFSLRFKKSSKKRQSLEKCPCIMLQLQWSQITTETG